MSSHGRDAFAHLPNLRDRILDPHKSLFRDLDYAALDAAAEANGLPPDWRSSDEEREANRREVLDGHRDKDLWLFAYGSLMWDPAFFFEEVRIGLVSGLQRRFCLHLPTGRGSADHPGLMAALDTGGSCEGLVFRIGKDKIETETEIVWRREMIADAYVPVFLPVKTVQGDVEALTFVANTESERYMGRLPIDDAADRIAHATGVLGSNLSYLENLSAQMRHLGIEDPQFEALFDRAQRLA